MDKKSWNESSAREITLFKVNLTSWALTEDQEIGLEGQNQQFEKFNHSRVLTIAYCTTAIG